MTGDKLRKKVVLSTLSSQSKESKLDVRGMKEEWDKWEQQAGS